MNYETGFSIYTVKFHNIQQYKEQNKLKEMVNNIFFHWALNLDICLSLDEPRHLSREVIRDIKKDDLDQKFPMNFYPSRALEYYNKANISFDNILCFMFYYEAIEFFFPISSRKALMDELKVIANRPLKLEGEELNNLIRRISEIKTENLDEQEQLTTLLKQCLKPEELLEKIKNIEKNRKKNIYTDRNICKERFNVDIGLVVLKPDVVIQHTAKRIYALRNALIHGKREHKSNFELYPGAETSEMIAEEILLLRWIAEEVIINIGNWTIE